MKCDYPCEPGKKCPMCNRDHGVVVPSRKQVLYNEAQQQLSRLRNLRIELLTKGRAKIRDGENILYVDNIAHEHVVTDFSFKDGTGHEYKPLRKNETIVISRSPSAPDTEAQYIELTPLEFEALVSPLVVRHLGFQRVGGSLQINLNLLHSGAPQVEGPIEDE